jgi:protein-S-isoprenylcysteine O-methyltransferase Ste14
MLVDLPFRAAIGILVGFAIASIVPAKMRSAATSPPDQPVHDTLWFSAAIRTSAFFLVGVATVYLLYPQAISRSSITLPDAFRWSGMPVGLISIALFVLSIRHLGKSLTGTAVVRAGGELVTTGPYRWVRHPYYVATAGLMLGVCLLSANGLLVLGCGLLLSLLAARLPQEERALLDAYGERYKKYAEQTGRFLPRVFRHKA